MGAVLHRMRRGVTVMQNIRERYADAVVYLADKHGCSSSGYVIESSATVQQCIGYTWSYIVEETMGHYRYDKYVRALGRLQRCHPDFPRATTVVHIDLGCGPGLFTWVVRDYFRGYSEVDLESYGHDHAPSMLYIADSLWQNFGEVSHYSTHEDLEELIHAVTSTMPESPDILVTIGHVLNQLPKNTLAIGNFAHAIVRFSNYATCYVVAVDAHTGDHRINFITACDELEKAVRQQGACIEMKRFSGSVMISRVCRATPK